MKSTNDKSGKFILFGILFFLSIPTSLNSQTYLIKSSSPQPPYYATSFEVNGSNLFITDGKLQVRSTSFPAPSLSLLQTEVYNDWNGLEARIQLLSKISDVKYGIYQFSADRSGVRNFFKDPIFIQDVEIRQGSDGNGILAVNLPSNRFDFVMNAGSPTPDPVTALSVNPLGIVVKGKAVTDSFQLITRHAEGKILVSDDEGNGAWADPSMFLDDDWLAEPFPGTGLYLNNARYDNVGIGTDHPKHKLQIEDGNILISSSHSKATGNTEGNLLFGGRWEQGAPDGNWGISYFNNALNFWKPETSLNPGGNFYFLIHDNGNAGIGFNEFTNPVPRAKLEIINSTMDKAGLIMNRVRSSQHPNAPMTNEIRFDTDSSEIWAMGAYLGEEHPNSFFIWNNLRKKTELFISENGKVGIGTINPVGKLEVFCNDNNIDLGLVLNQCSDSNNRNVIQFQRKGARHWTIGEDYDNYDQWDFSIRSLWQEDTIPAIYIQPNGMIGIHTDQPYAMLDVNGTLKVEQGVGIGTHAPNDPDWKLNVNGGIWAREVKVTVEAFPDYVFSKEYPLLSIADYDKFIAENNHLPGLPSSAEVDENEGIELGKLQVKLVEKIEEQALYIISLQKQVDELKELILNQKSE